MIKFLFKIIFVLALLFGIRMYANYMMTGKSPALDVDKSIIPDINISKLTDSISDKVDSVKNKVTPEAEETYLYKWRDDKGVIHYTSEKPTTEKQNLESIKINRQTNVVPAVTDASSSNIEQSQQQISNQEASELPTNIYSPEGIKQLLDQAKGVQSLMNDQFSEQENIINNQ